jgi:hypothetical protein
MAMSPENWKKVEAWAKSGKVPRCPSCGGTEQLINDSLFTLLELSVQGNRSVVSTTDSFFPVVAITCKACALVRFANPQFITS